jgi:hypothetical protein
MDSPLLADNYRDSRRIILLVTPNHIGIEYAAREALRIHNSF